jgi:hypothetical protein
MRDTERCPECGAPVAASIGGDTISACEPTWLAQITPAVRASTWQLPLQLTYLLLAMNLLPSKWWSILPLFALSAWWGMRVFPLSTPEPSLDESIWAHYILRVAAPLAPALFLGAVGLGLPGNPTAIWYMASLTTPAYCVFVAGWVAQLHLVQEFAERIPIPETADSLARHKWSIGICGGILLFCGVWNWFIGISCRSCLAVPLSLFAIVCAVRSFVHQRQTARLLNIDADEARARWLYHDFNATHGAAPPAQA